MVQNFDAMERTGSRSGRSRDMLAVANGRHAKPHREYLAAWGSIRSEAARRQGGEAARRQGGEEKVGIG
jgi:hypothetical protein